jgi:hypothetical protein
VSFRGSGGQRGEPAGCLLRRVGRRSELIELAESYRRRDDQTSVGASERRQSAMITRALGAGGAR